MEVCASRALRPESRFTGFLYLNQSYTLVDDDSASLGLAVLRARGAEKTSLCKKARAWAFGDCMKCCLSSRNTLAPASQKLTVAACLPR